MAEALAGCDPAELALCDALLTEAVAALAKGEAATETAWQWLAREATGRFATVERAADHEVLDRWLAPAVSHLATAERRRAVARALDGLGLHVWGRADDWQGVVPPDRLHAPVPYGSLAAVYRAAAVNVSIGHAQNVDSATQRLFDVPACGGFLLSDWRPSMADLFAPGEELVAFHSPGEARELAARYLADAPARQAVARRARERVVAAHTYCHRVEWIAREILERWPGLASRPHPRKTVAMSSPPALAAEVLGIVAGELVRDGFERPATRIAEALATVPEGRAASLTLKGHRAMASGNAATALAAYEASLAALRDASGATQFAAACATERLHGPAAALPLFGEAARLRPADAVAWTSLAACHLQLADWPRARHALERALRIAPDYVPALQCRAAFRAELEAVAPLDDEGSAATKSI